jgi:hypothetical protein
MVAWLRALITVGFTFAGRAFMQAYKNVTASTCSNGFDVCPQCAPMFSSPDHHY